MGDTEPETVLELLADDHAREILTQTSRQPMSAQELEDACGVSERTVYRRLERLESLGLVEESIEIDRDGHHRTQYETALKNVLVEIQNGEYKVHIRLEEDTADRFARIWNDIRNE